MGKKQTKHTHLVQKAYLKNFSFLKNGNNFVWRFDKSTGHIIDLPIKQVLVENYFYPQEIEYWLANDIEFNGIKTINKIVNEKSIEFMSSVEKTDLAKWILVQDLRTREYRNAIEQSHESVLKLIIEKYFVPHYAPELKDEYFSIEIEDYIKDVQMNMMKRFEREAPLIAKYHWILCINNTGIPYYTSDHPIIKDNTYHRYLSKLLRKAQYSSGLGYFSKGIEFHLPISSNLSIMLVDIKPLFQLLEQNMSIWYILADKIKPIMRGIINVEKKDLLYLNKQITAVANRYVISEKHDFTIAQQFLERYPELKNQNRKRWVTK